uniref:YbbR family protein n=1 Tax=uncultured prokaryote TaxID=198431 RepID=H5SPX1_9ZZZZ|nr:YbbR family protein [uncultured prokaryote]
MNTKRKEFLKRTKIRLKIYFRKIFLHNMGLKFFSVFMAFLLWIYVMSEEKTDVSIKVPLRFINLPSDLTIVGNVPSDIEVLLSGPKSIIFGLVNRRIEYKVDLKGASPGQTEINIQPYSLPVRSPAKVLKISPSRFTLNIERIVEKEVPVIPQVEGEVEKDYTISKISSIPEMVKIKGALSYLSKIEHVKTQKININGLTETKKIRVSLQSDPNIIDIQPKEIDVEVIVSEKIEKRIIEKIPVNLKGNFVRYRIEPPFITLTILGPVRKIRDIKTSDVNVYVDLSGESPGKYRRRATIELNEIFTLLDATPSWFDIFIYQ